jgi:hypothetical protein
LADGRQLSYVLQLSEIKLSRVFDVWGVPQEIPSKCLGNIVFDRLSRDEMMIRMDTQGHSKEAAQMENQLFRSLRGGLRHWVPYSLCDDD